MICVTNGQQNETALFVEWAEDASLLNSRTGRERYGKHCKNGYRYHVAQESDDIVGVVATRDNSHLYHLFVVERFQGQGLARKLWYRARKACLEAGNPGEFTVTSSRSAAGFYAKLGFQREAEVNHAGVVAITMRLREKAA